MKITICGHSSLYVEAEEERIFMDPVFETTLCAGSIEFYPARKFALSKLPSATILVITHAHFDHFVVSSVARLAREADVICPQDDGLIGTLRELGFKKITVLSPWQKLEIRGVRIQATPSSHEEPEFGVVIKDRTGAFWNMVDAEIDVEVGRTVARDNGGIDVVATRFQPQVMASVNFLRSEGCTFDAAQVAGWLDAALACEPRLVFPYAAGVRFRGRNDWFNRYAFPFTPQECAELLARRTGDPGKSRVVDPGDVINVQPGREIDVEVNASSFVRQVAAAPRVAWEPANLAVFQSAVKKEDQRFLKKELNDILGRGMPPWFAQVGDSGIAFGSDYVQLGIVWQLVVHLGSGRRLSYFIDFRDPGNVRIDSGVHPYGNYFTHISGRTLVDVLRRRVRPSHLWAVGDVQVYEKLLFAREDGFVVPPKPKKRLLDNLAEPLTYYLRHGHGIHVNDHG